ncbi:MAG: ribosomal protein S18-alanine N-acetyltransferase, partial [Cetobacterium sp.]
MNISDKIDKNYLEQISVLEKKIFSESFYNEEQLQEMIEKNEYLFFVAEKKSQILGYLIVHNSLDVMEIMKIAVREENRCQNIAGELFGKLLEITDIDIILEVREGNLGAIKFYEKIGMKKISLRKNYYSNNGENAVIMLLER